MIVEEAPRKPILKIFYLGSDYDECRILDFQTASDPFFLAVHSLYLSSTGSMNRTK